MDEQSGSLWTESLAVYGRRVWQSMDGQSCSLWTNNLAVYGRTVWQSMDGQSGSLWTDSLAVYGLIIYSFRTFVCMCVCVCVCVRVMCVCGVGVCVCASVSMFMYVCERFSQFADVCRFSFWINHIPSLPITLKAVYKRSILGKSVVTARLVAEGSKCDFKNLCQLLNYRFVFILLYVIDWSFCCMYVLCWCRCMFKNTYFN